MATKIIIKNSSVAGKVPDASALNAAELAVNLEDQKLYSKDADGNVFELGRGSTDSGGTGDRPTGPEIGDLYFDTDLEILLVWNGSEWEQITTGGDSLWVEDAGKLYPVTLTNNVQIGGTAADPNITLNASGSASFEGKVGIGTTSPSTVFHVVGANNNDATTLATAASDAKIRLQKSDISGLSKFQGTTDTGTCWYSQIANGNGSTAYNHVINPFGGNVGIGTTSPSQLLDVNGSATFAGKITAASTEDTDGGDTVVTKDYLEGAGSGGTGTLGYWDRSWHEHLAP